MLKIFIRLNIKVPQRLEYVAISLYLKNHQLEIVLFPFV